VVFIRFEEKKPNGERCENIGKEENAKEKETKEIKRKA
jgi:hypothetical protein